MCTVMNLATQEKQIYTCPAKQDVIAAYAQSQKDFNTWNYSQKYSSQLFEGKVTFICGDFSAFKDDRVF